MKNIKCVLFDSTDVLGKRIGGAETFLRGIIKYAPDDFEIEMIGTTANCQERPLNKKTSLTIGKKTFSFFPVVSEKNENKKSYVPLSLRYTLAMKRFRFDVQGKVLFFNRIEPSIVFKNLKVPKVVVIHNDIESQILRKNGSEVMWSKIPWLYFLFEKIAFSCLDRVYTVSEKSVTFYKEKYPKWTNKFSFLPTWVDAEIFYTSNKEKNILKGELQLPINKKMLLYVGRLQKQKAPMRLIDTFYQYYKKDKDSVLVIIGDGNLRESIKTKIKDYGIVNNVILIPYMMQNTLRLYYQAADVMVMTSNYEGMPICVLEALACGIPVVSTKVGEVPRLVKNDCSGEIVDSFEIKDILNALNKVLNHPAVYTKENCVNSVSEYTPAKILEPFYDTMRRLNKK